MSIYSLHVENWKNCTKCDLHKTRQRVVFAKGKIPADIVFTGEGPGKSENIIGQPFVGPAGLLLDKIIAKAVGTREVRIAFYNILGCMPPKEFIPNLAKDDRKLPPESVEACKPRIEEFLEMCQPKLIVALGEEPALYTGTAFNFSVRLPKGCKRICMDHPARIFHENLANQGLKIQRMVIQLANAITDMLETK
jgi:uracil-DNA glycosylase family 4